jgi:energy-coupling factor transporter ATP-binding protein EcfA2
MSPPDDKPRLSVVAASLANPPVAAAPRPAEAAPGAAGGDAAQSDTRPPGRPPKAPDRAAGEIFPGSAVTALGVDGKYFQYLDCLQQLRAVDTHTRDVIRGLYGGRSDLLERAWPRWSRSETDPKIIGWVHEDGAAAMQRACAEKGVWAARERVRGPGAWPDGQGGLILHCGDKVLLRGPKGGDDWRRPGEIGGVVYPAGPPGPRPADCDDGAGRAAADELLAAIGTWRWRRPEVDAQIALGWTVAAMVGGALAWRPLAWVTGDRGTGKSTLLELIGALMGGETGLVRASDASEAGIRQAVMHATLPVTLDELEAEADNRRQLAVVKLARQAASGGFVLRGGADHKGQEFRVRSCFLFSSILLPPILDQDISRIALLELDQLPRGATPPKIDPAHWAALGRRIRRRCWDLWPRLHETLELYRAALARAGHGARGCDQFGTLLALADLVLHGGEPDGEVLDGWAARLAAGAVADQTDESDSWQRMLGHLCSQVLDVYRSGIRFTVGELIAAAADLPDNGTGFDWREARKHLRRIGIGIEGTRDEARVEIANQHDSLSALFRDTRWAAGVHRQDVRRIPGAEAGTGVHTFAYVGSRFWVFPLKSIPWFLDPAPGQPAATRPEDLLAPFK